MADASAPHDQAGAADTAERELARAYWIGLGLPKRTAGALAEDGIYDRSTLERLSEQEISRLINMGKVGIAAINRLLGRPERVPKKAGDLGWRQEELISRWRDRVGEERMLAAIDQVCAFVGDDAAEDRAGVGSALVALVRRRRAATT